MTNLILPTTVLLAALVTTVDAAPSSAARANDGAHGVSRLVPGQAKGQLFERQGRRDMGILRVGSAR